MTRFRDLSTEEKVAGVTEAAEAFIKACPFHADKSLVFRHGGFSAHSWRVRVVAGPKAAKALFRNLVGSGQQGAVALFDPGPRLSVLAELRRHVTYYRIA